MVITESFVEEILKNEYPGNYQKYMIKALCFNTWIRK